MPLVLIALAGFFVASYLTLFQVGVIATVWEPFFGRGSERILTSSVSRLLPVPDAALGAAGYLADAVTGVIGGTRRWRTMPWMVILFGIAVGPLGATSVLLVVLQPLLYDTWCTLCLASAVISLVMIGPAMDEVLASLQWMLKRHGADRERRIGAAWPRAGGVVVGVGLTLAPALLPLGEPASTHLRLVGPIVASLSFVALWSVTRELRYLVLPAAAALIALPLVYSPAYSAVAAGISAGAGLALLILHFPTRRGAALGGGWRAVIRAA